MIDSWKKVYLPVVVNPGRCKDCRDCVYACPVKALDKSLGMTIVDREKCAQYVLEEEECLECIIACKSMAMSLRAFVINVEGVISQE